MIIPCIDLQAGKVVQLVLGREKALELGSIDEALTSFEAFPLLHVIDLDAAMGRGDNSELVRLVAGRRATRVGGGVRSVERAVQAVEMGARQVIVGTAAFCQGGIDHDFLTRLNSEIGMERVIVAIDSRSGHVSVKGWSESLDLTPERAAELLNPYCGGLLCTFVDSEGTMTGTDLALFSRLRRMTEKTLVAAGGVASLEEVRTLVDMNIEVALGMAIYTGRLEIQDLLQFLPNQV